MTTMLLWQFVWLPLILFMAYPIAIQFERGGAWRVLLPFYVATVLVNIWLNYTTLAAYTGDFPKWGEWTFSRRVKRLQFDLGRRGAVARVIRDYLNFWQKGHV